MSCRSFAMLMAYAAVALLLCAGVTGAVSGDAPPAPPSSYELQQINTTSTFHSDKYEDGKPVIHFFYNQNCGECLQTLPYVQEFANEHPEYVVRYYDIRENATNNALFQQFNEEYGVGFSPVPSAFAGDYELSGFEEITGYLPLIAERMADNSTVPVEVPHTPSIIPDGGTSSELTIPLVITAALIDGINPCAFAVLIFLLVAITSLDSRKKMLLVGSTFIFAVFVFYFFSGLGIFTIIQTAGISRLISLIAALIALAAGIISIRDGLTRGNSTPLTIPESRKGIIERYARKGSVPAAFVLGVLVGMFELPCTGGIYLAILSLLSNNMTMTEGIPYLLVYNIIFILPLVVILAIVAFGVSTERLDRWRIEKRRLIRFAMGAVMIVLGLVLLAEVLL
jgi:cytochrome c biogenesis protein CcdA